MSEQGSIGRGRIVAGGRGAQLLAALEASRRPGQPSVSVEPPSDPTLPSSAAISDVSAPKAPAGTGSPLVQLLARKRVMGSAASPEVATSAFRLFHPPLNHLP